MRSGVFTPRWSRHRRSSIARALAALSALSVLVVFQLVLFAGGSASAEPECEQTRTEVIFDDRSYIVPMINCVDTIVETTTETTVETTVQTVPVVTTETVLSPTTETTSVPTTVELPTTVGVPVTETTTTTEPDEFVDSTVTEQVTERVTETETETNTVVVAWGYGSTVNPATGQLPAVSLSAVSPDGTVQVGPGGNGQVNPGGTVQVSPGGTVEVRPGGTLTVSVRGFTPGELVQIWFHSDPVLLGEVIAGEDGSAQAVVTIPLDAQAGQHAIRVVGLSSGVEVSIPLTVVAASAAGEQGDDQLADTGAAAVGGGSFDGTGSGSSYGTELSYTGVNTQQSLITAAVLVVVGAGLAFFARRTLRKPAGSHHQQRFGSLARWKTAISRQSAR
jgi:hypothetical protein